MTEPPRPAREQADADLARIDRWAAATRYPDVAGAVDVAIRLAAEVRALRAIEARAVAIARADPAIRAHREAVETARAILGETS